MGHQAKKNQLALKAGELMRAIVFACKKSSTWINITGNMFCFLFKLFQTHISLSSINKKKNICHIYLVWPYIFVVIKSTCLVTLKIKLERKKKTELVFQIYCLWDFLIIFRIDIIREVNNLISRENVNLKQWHILLSTCCFIS